MAIKKELPKLNPRFIDTNTTVKRIVHKPHFPRIYLIISLIILLATTLFWAALGAHLQTDNADQFVDSYMFSNYHTFHGASFPVAHTFLLKWPVFALIAFIGISAQTVLIATIACVLVTIAAFVFILSRIERRPIVLGTICLGLASMLLLVPAQPYPGGLLPVNMAMLATRNIEYIFYLGALAVLAKTARIRSRSFWLAVLILSLLLASDRLFLGLSAGGALLALVAYALSRNWTVVSLAARWLVASCAALIGASLIIWVISASGLTHIVGGSENSPYGLTQNAKNGAEGAVFAITGFVTNFGANPAHAAVEFKDIPSLIQHNLISVGGPAYVINFVSLVFGLWLILAFVGKNILRSYKNKSANLDAPAKLSTMLVCSTLAALAIFVASQHQYSVDSRYLGIALPALFISITVVLRSKKWPAERFALIGLTLCVGILFGIASVAHDQHKNTAALHDIHNRDELIAQAMKGRHTQVLIGDYWRVVPTQLASNNELSVWPLSACTQPRSILTSEAWRPDITHGFAYLLSLDRGLTDYPQCSLQQVLDAYGRPNASLPIAGNLSHPKELLLFYDHGIHKSSPLTAQPQKGPATVLPITTDQLPNTMCEGPTIMNIVAHQDDDLLFLSPDLLHDVQDGHCVRTIYLTAGDSGHDKFYWLGRQQGSEAAYSAMVKDTSSVWVQRIVKVSESQYITVANMRGNPKVSLIFMNLPDGNLKGEGFGSSRDESLAKLLNGNISTMHTVDGESSYTSPELIKTLSTIMHLYQPAEIRTQANNAGGQYPDHSDHRAAGQFASKAHDAYERQQFDGLVHIPMYRYKGYPVHELPPNVSGQDLQHKEAAFFAYAKYDGATCHSQAECSNTPTYSAYLNRQYQETGH